MKKIQCILLLLGVLALGACSNYNNFNKRKFTKGRCRPGIARIKVEKEAQENDVKTVSAYERADASFQKNAATRSQTVPEVMQGQGENVKHVAVAQTSIALKGQGSGKTYSTEAIRMGISDKATSFSVHQNELAVTSKGKEDVVFRKDVNPGNKRKKKKELTYEERSARATLVLGIIAVSLSTLIFILAPFIGFLSPTFFTLYSFLRIPALLGVLGVFKGTAFYKQPLEGKYQKYRRKGLFLSIFAVAFWLITFVL